MNDSDITELRGQLIDIVEDYLTSINKSSGDNVFIRGRDYDELGDKFIDTLKNWGLL